VRDDAHFVALGQRRQLQSPAGERRRDVDRLAVESGFNNLIRGDVDVRGGTRLGAGETRDGDGAEHRTVRWRQGEVELDVVLRHGQQPGALASLVTGQVLGTHDVESVTAREDV